MHRLNLRTSPSNVLCNCGRMRLLARDAGSRAKTGVLLSAVGCVYVGYQWNAKLNLQWHTPRFVYGQQEARAHRRDSVQLSRNEAFNCLLDDLSLLPVYIGFKSVYILVVHTWIQALCRQIILYEFSWLP